VSDSLRPVVALDLDGVFRIFSRDGEAPADALEVPVTFRSDAWPRNWFHRELDWDADGTLTFTDLISGPGRTWVQSLVDRDVELVWATTWKEHANTYFADVLGIPHLEDALLHEEPRFKESSSSWKARNLRAAFPGRPVLWVDDNIFDFVERRPPRDRALTLLHEVNPLTGITADDVAVMEEWLGLAGTTDGQQELRRRRRRAGQRRYAQMVRDQFGSPEGQRVFKLVEARIEKAHPRHAHLAWILADHAIDQRGQAVDTDSIIDTLTGPRCGLTKEQAAQLIDLAYVEGFHAPRR